MPIFKSPQYSKSINPKTGNHEPRYVFPIEFSKTDEKLSFIADSVSDITLSTIQKCVLENINWWNTFISNFLVSTSKLFSKPYTVENINKITKHTLSDVSNIDTFPASVTLYPKTIEISGGIFWVNWGYDLETIVIDIPDLQEPMSNTIEAGLLPVSKNLETSMEELNIDDLPVGNDSTEEALEIDSPVKFYDRQRVKEARLKAKLAVYKAQRQMAKYMEKYGSEISDSDTDCESSDEESEDENSGEEEVQI
jgi:hypothetical protein